MKHPVSSIPRTLDFGLQWTLDLPQEDTVGEGEDIRHFLIWAMIVGSGTLPASGSVTPHSRCAETEM